MLLEETESADALKSLQLLQMSVKAQPGNAHRVHMCGTQLERLGRMQEATDKYLAAIEVAAAHWLLHALTYWHAVACCHSCPL